MYILVLLILIAVYVIFTRKKPNCNLLRERYDTYIRNVFPFNTKISRTEQNYISTITRNHDYYTEFDKGFEISPYSFCIAVDKKTNDVNLTKLNIGSVENDITKDVTRVLTDIGIHDSICAPNYKYYGIGWDLVDKIIKFYTLRLDRSKIACHVYKVERDKNNNITKAVFITKKMYDVGETNTIMHKDGKKINQVNVSRIKKHDAQHVTANAWINKMHALDFTLDTYSDYNGKISLYFD
jgi:hypothetical protein